DLRAVLADLEKLEPTGEANPAPRVLFEDLEVLEVRTIKGHLKLDLRLRGEVVSAFGPDLGERAASLSPGDRVTLVGKLKRDHFRGGDLPEILIMYVGRGG
ncbi:MAG: single-stranded-DNA-specific exonuclease RecJ, partial [Myxococcales bacterium]|nr:single-stranded-DNA-specific exonuclease RecJ [Myxococcales bacterium]